MVGYWALSAVRQKQNTMVLSDSDKQSLLQIARNTIITYLQTKRITKLDITTFDLALRNKAGAFITLKKHNELRGCIGHFETDKPLCEMVQEMAIAASTQDYRFPEVKVNELVDIDIEISVLTPMQRIKDPGAIRLGIDGVYIRKGNRSGTFLPQVATDTGWNLEDFLGHCASDKAGIGWYGWKDKDAEIYVYQALIFGEKE